MSTHGHRQDSDVALVGRTGWAKSRDGWLAAMLALVCLLLVPALAWAEERGHEPGVPFGGAEGGFGGLLKPVGVAVGEGLGLVYVTDRGGNRVDVFSASEHVFVGWFDGSGESAWMVGGRLEVHHGVAAGGGRLVEPDGIAVDNSCVVRKLKEPTLEQAKCEAEDPSNGDVYVIDGNPQKVGGGELENRVIDKFTAMGEFIGEITGETIGVKSDEEGYPQFDGFHGVAVDGAGNVVASVRTITRSGDVEGSESFVVFLANGVVNQLVAGGSRSLMGAPSLGVGVDDDDDVFVLDGNGGSPALFELGVSGEVVREFDKGESDSSGLSVELCSGDLYVDVATEREYAPYGGAAVWQRFAPEVNGSAPVEELPIAGGDGAGIAVDCASGTVFVGEPGSRRVEPFPLEKPGAPVVKELGVIEVTGGSARFSGRVNPRSEPGETATEYRFEYGACASVLACPVGEGFEGVVAGKLAAMFKASLVSGKIEGLVSGRSYHVRLVAKNGFGETVDAREGVFTTQGVGGFELPDDRGYELVSPPDKYGSGLDAIEEQGVVQAAANGDAITYLATGGTELDPLGVSNDVQVYSARGRDGWVSKDVALGHVSATGPSTGTGEEYRFFSSDLSVGLVQPLGAFVPSLSGKASEQTPYLSRLGASGEPSSMCSTECFEPLVTAANTSGEAPFGISSEGKPCPPEVICGPSFVGGTPDLSDVVLKSTAPLLEGAPKKELYEWSGGVIEPVSELPDGQYAPSAAGAELGFRDVVARGAVSDNGKRVFWMGLAAGGWHLYMRDVAREETLEVGVPETGAAGGTPEPVFQYATGDGEHVFFTDPARLTKTSRAEPGKPDLYECTIEETETGLACRLEDLTPEGAGGEPANVQGLVLGGSEDGSRVYFVADGRLSSNKGSSGEEAVKGTCMAGASGNTSALRCNLYLSENGVVRLIGVLGWDDAPDWAGLDDDLSGLVSRVSPDGRWLLFMSNRSLTGYDNTDVASGLPDEEVFEYHDPSTQEHERGASEGVICVSCNPSGARPQGVEYEKTEPSKGLSGGNQIWQSEQWLAGWVPGGTPYALSHALYLSRSLSENGRVFFDSSDALVPYDRNGTVDVYEYEPVGVGSCETNSPRYSPLSSGCVDLISTGASGQESAFLDASENGNDVFFLTYQPISKRDHDTALDVYDARVGGGEPTPEEPVECGADNCTAQPPPPESPTPDSLTFNGLGNQLTSPAPGTATNTTPKTKSPTRAQRLSKALEACHKDRAKSKRRRCEQRARSAYGAHAGKGKRRGR